MRFLMIFSLISSTLLLGACGKYEAETKEDTKQAGIDKVFGNLPATKINKSDKKE